LVFLFSVRTKLFFLKAKAPSKLILLLSIPAALITVLVPFTTFGNSFFKFETPTSGNIAIIVLLVLIYFVVTETVKLVYYKLNKA